MYDCDCIVLGAGVAGLTAAHALRKGGFEVRVLEARDRVGGRTFSGTLAGAAVDWGGQWIGEGQPLAYELVKELGLGTFPTWDQGTRVLEMNGRRSTYRGTVPWMAPWKLLQVQLGIWQIDRKARTIDPVLPWTHPEAAAWDARTLDDERRRFMPSAESRAVMDAAMRTVFGADSADLSLFHALAYVRSAGSLARLIDTEGGFQQDRIRGGAQGIALALAAALGDDRVHRGCAATAVSRDEAGVTVRDAQGQDWRARRAIVAIPVGHGAKIAWAPALPPARTALMARAPMAAAVKCFARYETAFWRARGFSGEAVSGDGPLSVTFDACGENGANPCLLAFVGGSHARAWQSQDPEARKAIVLDRLARYFGDEARRPIAYAEHDWSTEAWSGGGPITLWPRGVLSQYGSALREPVGPIHWAGTETARHCMGFIEGAIESGQRAAAEVGVALRGGPAGVGR